MRPLDFIRHGSTRLNGSDGGSRDRIRGWMDVPLDDRGRQEAQKLGQQLCKSQGVKPSFLVASDLQRAGETAYIISKLCGIQFLGGDHAFRPWGLGKFQGQESAKVHPILQQYIHNPDTPVPGGESFHQFESRFLRGVKFLLRRGGRPGLVSHHRNERLLASLEKNGWSGQIDIQEFTKVGDAPGHMAVFEIPLHLLG